MRNSLTFFNLFRSNKLSLLALLFFFILAIPALYIFELKVRKDVYQVAQTTLQQELDTKALMLKGHLKDSVSSINFLNATPPISGISRAAANDLIDPLLNTPIAIWQTRLAEIFSGFMRTDPQLLQARYITLADNGQEIVRVDRINDALVRLEGDLLQQKGQRDYMLNASKLDSESVYISPINYNREHGQIQIPYVSTYRVAKPVFNKQGTVFAVLVTNYFADELFNNVTFSSPAGVDVYLLNDQQQFLFHPDPKLRFGFEFGQDITWSSVFSQSQDMSSQATLPFHDLPSHYYLKQRISLENNISMLPLELAVSINTDILAKDVAKRRDHFVLVIISLFTALWLLVWLYQRYINRKLELHSLKERNNKIIENSLDAILTVQEDGLISNANKTALQCFDIIIDHTRFTQLFTLTESDKSCIDETIAHGSKPQFEGVFIDPQDQQHFYSITLTSVFDIFTQRYQVAAILRNINSLKQTQVELEKLNSTLEQKVRQRTTELESAIEQALAASKTKSDFIANISHEIRTPMNGVLGMLEMLKEDTLTQQQQQYLELANSSANSLMTLINDILDFSKIEAGKLDIDNHSFDVITVCSDMITSMALQAQRKGLEVFLYTDKVIDRMLVGDSHRLKQILINLLNNAFKFTHQGEVSLTVGCQYLTEEKLLMSFVIEDSGIGIAEKNIDKLFEAFTQEDTSTTRHFGGTGLGLSICRKLAQLMGGDISVTSEKGKGSCFTAQVQLHIAAEKKLNTAVELAKDIQVGVLIDSDSVYNNVTNLLIKNCQVAANNIQRFDYQAQYQELKVDLLVVDNDHPYLQTLINLCNKQNKKYVLILRDLLLSKKAKEQVPENCHVLNKPLTQDQFSYKLASLFGVNNSFLVASQGSEQTEYVEYDFSNFKVLLVDDNMINLEVAKAILKNTGVTIVCASDGLDALEILNTEQTLLFDLILMDCQMPNLNGYDTTSAIRCNKAGADYAKVPIIAMTASAMAGDRERCITAGMNDYITKPIKPKVLKDKLAMWLK
ncbi:response regulator [Pseudoalteromonas sp. SR44-8]|uniref:ATP-binding protein n=1 Tax=Pseudoalteromonas sp. SR44-8 TaxID=2760933 RepID=UPI001602FB87|nr:ATP-binding protein [Pseudoalteromonas sp. SR44-8]MBB1300331.1 response regulator [Pseudoalteromonas sp. SR44-8]